MKPFLIYFLPVAAFGVGAACGDSEDHSGTHSFFDCMEQIRNDRLAPQDCRHRAGEICYALSREVSLSTRMRLSFAETKAIVSDFIRLAGVEFEPWTHADCVAVHQELCKDFSQYFPCQYELCLAEISEECAACAAP